jgi:hypothetical protein
LCLNRKGRHFGTIKVIKAESLTVLDTLTEHNIQDEFPKRQKRWDWHMRA